MRCWRWASMAMGTGRSWACRSPRPLDAGPCTFIAADALVLKAREGGRVVNVHALLAVGVNGDGHREILGLQVTSAAGRRALHVRGRGRAGAEGPRGRPGRERPCAAGGGRQWRWAPGDPG